MPGGGITAAAASWPGTLPRDGFRTRHLSRRPGGGIR
jgi:hypothetical protein